MSSRRARPSSRACWCFDPDRGRRCCLPWRWPPISAVPRAARVGSSRSISAPTRCWCCSRRRRSPPSRRWRATPRSRSSRAGRRQPAVVRPPPRRCCACVPTWCSRPRSAPRPRSRCCSRKASRCVRDRPAAELRRHPRRHPPARGRARRRRNGARRCSPRWTRGSPRCPSGASRARAGLGAARLHRGAGHAEDAVLRAAGLDQRLGRRPRRAGDAAPHPPDLLVVPTPAGLSVARDRLLDHPASAGIRAAYLPPALTICAGPFTAEAAECWRDDARARALLALLLFGLALLVGDSGFGVPDRLILWQIRLPRTALRVAGGRRPRPVGGGAARGVAQSAGRSRPARHHRHRRRSAR